MNETINNLKDLGKAVGSVEEMHNDVVDKYTHLQDDKSSMEQDIFNELNILRDELKIIRESIRERVVRARSATLLLSLIAQKEEFEPIKSRVDQQMYEQYIDKEWLLRALESSSKGG